MSTFIVQATGLAGDWQRRDAILSDVITQLSGVMQGLAARGGVETLIAQTRALVGGLYQQGQALTVSTTGIANATSSITGMFARTQPVGDHGKACRLYGRWSGPATEETMTVTVESVVTVPEWFAGALAELPEHREVEVAGSVIHLRCWGPAGTAGVVLVHGGSAHSGWWDHIAPLLGTTHRVVALDLSGHGDSATRSQYPIEGWAEEVMAAAEAGGVDGQPYIVGHSMGGRVAGVVGARHSKSVAGLVIIDSPFQEPPEEAIARQLRRTPKTYATEEEICAQFRTVPEQDTLPHVARHVAAESVRKTDDGWVWKFDPDMLRKRLEHGRIPPLGPLRTGQTPVVYIRCEHGLVGRERVPEIAELFDRRATVVELAEAGHHPMMDQPLALVATLRTVLAQWDSMRPGAYSRDPR